MFCLWLVWDAPASWTMQTPAKRQTKSWPKWLFCYKNVYCRMKTLRMERTSITSSNNIFLGESIMTFTVTGPILVITSCRRELYYRSIGDSHCSITQKWSTIQWPLHSGLYFRTTFLLQSSFPARTSHILHPFQKYTDADSWIIKDGFFRRFGGTCCLHPHSNWILVQTKRSD